MTDANKVMAGGLRDAPLTIGPFAVEFFCDRLGWRWRLKTKGGMTVFGSYAIYTGVVLAWVAVVGWELWHG